MECEVQEVDEHEFCDPEIDNIPRMVSIAASDLQLDGNLTEASKTWAPANDV